jgi:hypothetical protein
LYLLLLSEKPIPGKRTGKLGMLIKLSLAATFTTIARAKSNRGSGRGILL